MFSDLIGRSGPDPLPEIDPDLALAALMVRIARADGDYAPVEVERIDRVLSRRLSLGPREAADLRARAEALEAEAPDTVRFTRALKEGVPYEARRGLVQALWSVVLADGVRDDEEDGLLRLVAPLLGVNDRDSALARQAAERAADGALGDETKAGTPGPAPARGPWDA